MQLEGQESLPVPAERAWALLTDPQVLAAAIPGCQALSRTDNGTLEGVVRVEVPVCQGTYRFRARVEPDGVPPGTARVEVAGEGDAGAFRARAEVSLEPLGDETLVGYRCRLELGGVLAALGPRALQPAVRWLLWEFFAGLRQRARERG